MLRSGAALASASAPALRAATATASVATVSMVSRAAVTAATSTRTYASVSDIVDGAKVGSAAGDEVLRELLRASNVQEADLDAFLADPAKGATSKAVEGALADLTASLNKTDAVLGELAASLAAEYGTSSKEDVIALIERNATISSRFEAMMESTKNAPAVFTADDTLEMVAKDAANFQDRYNASDAASKFQAAQQRLAMFGKTFDERVGRLEELAAKLAKGALPPAELVEFNNIIFSVKAQFAHTEEDDPQRVDAEYVAQKNLMSVDELYAKVETDAALKAELESAPRTQQLLESIAAKNAGKDKTPLTDEEVALSFKFDHYASYLPDVDVSKNKDLAASAITKLVTGATLSEQETALLSKGAAPASNPFALSAADHKGLQETIDRIIAKDGLVEGYASLGLDDDELAHAAKLSAEDKAKFQALVDEFHTRAKTADKNATGIPSGFV